MTEEKIMAMLKGAERVHQATAWEREVLAREEAKYDARIMAQGAELEAAMGGHDD